MVRAVFVLSVALVCAGVSGCLSAWPTQAGMSTDEEGAVYNAFVDYRLGLEDEKARQKEHVFVIEDITSFPGTLDAHTPMTRLFRGNEVGADLLADYNGQNTMPRKVRLVKRPGVTYYWISPGSRERMFRYVPGKEPWQEFRNRHNGATLLQFSRVGFNTERTAAVVHVFETGDDMGHYGMYVLLRREGETWHVVAHAFSEVT